MKILHIHPSLASGGIEAMICALANEMSKQHEATVCSIFTPKDNHIFWHKLNYKVQRETIGKQTKGFSINEIFKIYSFIRKQQFDVVYTHGFIQYYLLSVLLLHKKVKICYTVHSDAYMENIGWSKLLFPIKRFFFRFKWIFPITISHASQESFTKLYKCTSTLIYNGMPSPAVQEKVPDLIAELRRDKNTKIFVHAGRISEAKNQFALCRAFDRLIRNNEDVVLLIAGPNDNQSIFNQLQPYFSDKIIYLGLRSDIIDLMAYSDAMCLPSLWEGLPVVLLEAISVGCIPICSPVGGIIDVVDDGYNGILSKSSSEDDYYHALNKFLDMSDSQIVEMKMNAMRSFKNYDIVHTTQKYLDTI